MKCAGAVGGAHLAANEWGADNARPDLRLTAACSAPAFYTASLLSELHVRLNSISRAVRLNCELSAHRTKSVESAAVTACSQPRG